MNKLLNILSVRILLNVYISGASAIFLSSCKEEDPTPTPKEPDVAIITGFSPESGLPGTSVTITGLNFSTDVNGNTVKFAGVAATVSEASATTIKTTVPNGASTGKIEITVNNKTATSTTNFIVPPTLTGFSPIKGVAGTTVQITGTGFGNTPAENKVTFNGRPAVITSASSTALTVTVPNDASTGKIIIDVDGATVTSVDNFTLIPVLTGYSQPQGAVNEQIIISGSGFGVPFSTNLVEFGTVTATIISGTANELTVKVPVGAVSAPIKITSGDHSVTGPIFNVVVEAIQAGGTGFDVGYAVAVDGLGNTYIAGSFQNAMTIGTTVLTGQNEEIFVVKFNAEAEYLWAASAGGAGNDRAVSIALDQDGNAYITGYFAGSAAFGSSVVSASGSSALFVARINASGNFGWVKSFGSTGSDIDQPGAITVDGSGRVIAAGSFYQSINIGAISLSSAGGADIFVSTFNKDSGQELWANRFGSTKDEYAFAVAATLSNVVYVGGTFLDFTSLGSSDFTSGGEFDGFLMKLDNSGEYSWATQISGSGWNMLYGLTSDAQGNALATGYFTNSASFGTISISGTAREDAFLAKFSATNGNTSWVRRGGGSGSDIARSVTVDNTGKIYTTGYFESQASFGDFNLTAPANSRDVFVTAYDGNGSIQWAKRAGSQDSEEGNSIAAGPSGIVHTVGFFRALNTTFNATELTNSGADDIFLWKIWPR